MAKRDCVNTCEKELTIGLNWQLDSTQFRPRVSRFHSRFHFWAVYQSSKDPSSFTKRVSVLLFRQFESIKQTKQCRFPPNAFQQRRFWPSRGSTPKRPSTMAAHEPSTLRWRCAPRTVQVGRTMSWLELVKWKDGRDKVKDHILSGAGHNISQS